MRILTYLLVPIAIISIIGNVILYNKTEGRRAQITINGKVITKGDFNTWLATRYGRNAQAQMAKYTLVEQAAQQNNCPPDETEIKQAMDDAVARDPRVAVQLAIEPWRRIDMQQELEYRSALANLMIKDQKASDEELRSFFADRQANYQIPDKYEVRAVAARNMQAAQTAVELFKKIDDATIVSQQLQPNVNPVGADGTWVLVKPIGFGASQIKDPVLTEAMRMKVGEVAMVTVPGGAYVIKLMKVTPGSLQPLDAVRARVARDFKLQHALPASEVLRKLWDKSTIVTDPPTVKADIESLLFPKLPSMQAGAAQP